jgi:hypothetical protein
MTNLKNTERTKVYHPSLDFMPTYKAMNEYCKVENLNPLNEDLNTKQVQIEEVMKKQEALRLAKTKLIQEENELVISVRSLFSDYRQVIAFLKARSQEMPHLKNILRNFKLNRRKKGKTTVENTTESLVSTVV